MGFVPSIGKFELDFAHDGRFSLFSCKEVFCPQSFEVLSNAFSEVSWVRKVDPFYIQYESFVKPQDNHALASLYHPDFFFPFKERLEKQLGISFQNRIRLAAHKLITSDEIGLHNDYTLPELGHENFRFIFQFSNRLENVSGGDLSFWASKYTREEIRTFPLCANQGVCFQITPHSYHSVSPVDGERYTLVMYLWEEGRSYNGMGAEIIPFIKK